jgi:uncharacterized protein (TIGR02271 family)
MGNADQGRVWEIDTGWDVYAADGDKIGSVEDVQTHYVVVGKGLIFHTERYVPVSAITSVDGDAVYLSVTKDAIDSQGWDTAPDMTSGTYSTTDTDSTTGTTGFDETTDLRTRGRTTERDSLKVPVMEEELDVRKREVERGSVRVHKDVVEETETFDVPLREETIHVERHAATGDETAGIGDHAFEEQDIEIQLRGEEAEVTKQARVKEHVHISKDVRERDKQVSGTVRHEEVVVEGEDTTTDLDRRP